MLRLPQALLSPETAEQYCIDPYVATWTSGEHLIHDVISEDEGGDCVEGAEDSLSASWASAPNSPPGTCVLFAWLGWPPTEPGNATRTPSTTMRKPI
jgi:hypothetical protein